MQPGINLYINRLLRSHRAFASGFTFTLLVRVIHWYYGSPVMGTTTVKTEPEYSAGVDGLHSQVGVSIGVAERSKAAWLPI